MKLNAPSPVVLLPTSYWNVPAEKVAEVPAANCSVPPLPAAPLPLFAVIDPVETIIDPSFSHGMLMANTPAEVLRVTLP